MPTELSKNYNPNENEEKIYSNWMEKGYFHAEVNENKTPFTIVIPPPNITGQLHMGHALDNMIQDALIRMKRMQGFEALWMPGTDHASIATEVKIVEVMAKEGLTKEIVGRDAFLIRAWAWKEKYGGRIVEQLKKLGSSLDWKRERFTMDEGLSIAVKTAFKHLYDKGLIYQGYRIINWCPCCLTALSDAEVEYEEDESHLWLIRYPGEDGGEGIIIATTRPETMLGDVAVAVNPNDKRYLHLIGKNVILPLINKSIPVIADEYVDIEFGTGAVKITPAHDPNDYEVGLRHNLPIMRIMDNEGKINEEGGKYFGKERFEARKQIVSDLTKLNLLQEVKAHKHNVGHCYRCGTVIEPILSKQWFVKMKELAESSIKAVEEGKVIFVPNRFSKIYFNWMRNIKDWCISRQLWWGHRIPAYTCESCGNLIVEIDTPEFCSKCGNSLFVQDEDVLDTWFSSGLWPFSTLGWPEKTPELSYFYPTNVLVTSYDIIFFWVARMIFFGIEMMGEIPFKYVDIHGLVRDDKGRKMSKSLNNGIDPLEIIDKYGADALRFSLAMGVNPGNDMRFNIKKVEAARNFANKIWNVSRFVLMNIDNQTGVIDSAELDIADNWILSKLNETITSVSSNMEKMEIGLAAQRLYDFIWAEFCDWYVEMSKSRLYSENNNLKNSTCNILVYILKNTLKLLHPFMPFITEKIYTSLPGSDETIMLSAWPVLNIESDNKKAVMMEYVMELIRGIRNIRAEMNVPPSNKTDLTILTYDPVIIETCSDYLKKLAYINNITIITDKNKIPQNCISIVTAIGEAYLPLKEMIDINKEIIRMTKEKELYESEIQRAESKLNNNEFIKKAPLVIVEEERNKLDKFCKMKIQIEERITNLQGMKDK